MNTSSTTKNNIISTSVDCCVAFNVPLLPPPAAFVRYCRSRCIRLIVVSVLHPQRPQQFTVIVAFSPISPALFRLIVVLSCILFDPTSPRPLPD